MNNKLCKTKPEIDSHFFAKQHLFLYNRVMVIISHPLFLFHRDKLLINPRQIIQFHYFFINFRSIYVILHKYNYIKCKNSLFAKKHIICQHLVYLMITLICLIIFMRIRGLYLMTARSETWKRNCMDLSKRKYTILKHQISSLT